MNKKDEDLLNIGVLLGEDTEKLEVMYEGFDICNFILGMIDAELRGKNSPEAIGHLRALYNIFNTPMRSRYEIRALVWKNRYAAANSEEDAKE